jgi:hypothetical protein
MTQDTFQQAIERYRDAKEAFREQRDRMLEDAKFSNPAAPEQWDDAARRIRTQGPDGARPCLTLDHTNQYIRQVVNDCRQNKPGLQALPASSGARQEVATAIEGMFRHIEYRSRAQIAYDNAVEHAARMGLGWIRVMPEVVNEKLNFQEVRICRVHNPLAITVDPNWVEPDGMDIGWGFVESNIAKKTFERQYPGKDTQAFDSKSPGGSWFQENTVRIAEYLEVVEKKQNRLVIRLPDGTRRDVGEDEYWDVAKQIGTQPLLESDYMGSERKVLWRKMNGNEILEETTFPSRWIGLVPVIGNEVWIDEKRYLSGMVRSMMEAQRAYNYERSAWVEAVALQPKAPYEAAAESIAGFEDDWKAANRSNKAVLTWNARDDDGNELPKPTRMPPPNLPAAFAQGAQFADNDIQASVGMYRASVGAPTAEHSGIAIRQKRQEGDTANFHFGDNLNTAIAFVGRIVIDMLPRLYDEKREAHILGLDGTVKAVKIDPNGDAYSVRPDGETTINLGTGDYDVMTKAGPSYTTLREEASDGLTELMKGQPAIAAVVAPIWARMQDWPEADKLSKALLAMAPPPVQQALADENKADDIDSVKQQLEQCQQQLQHMQGLVQQAGDQLAKAQADEKQAQVDGLTKAAQLKIDQYNAETQRMKVLGAGMTAEQVQALVLQTIAEAQAQGAPDGSQAGQAPALPAGDDEPAAPDLPTGVNQNAPNGPIPVGDGAAFPLANQPPPAPGAAPTNEPPQGGFSSPEGP